MWENGGMETPKYLLCGYLIFAWPCYTGGKKSIPMCKNMNDSHKYWPWHLKKKKKKHDVEKTLIWKDTGIPMFTAELKYNSQDTDATQVSFKRWTDKEDVLYKYTQLKTEKTK